MFEAWGRFVFRRRWWMLAVSLAVLVAALVVQSMGGTLSQNQQVSTDASRADALIAAQLPQGPQTTGFALAFSSSRLAVGNSAFRRAMQAALAPLRTARVQRADGSRAPIAISPTLDSADRHTAVVQVTVSDSFDDAKSYYPYLRSLVHSNTLHVAATGDLPVDHDFNSYLSSGLSKAGRVALPLSLVLLLLAFGTVVAAILPLGVGVLTIIAGTAGALLINRIGGVDPGATEFITLLGLGLAIDYSLFIVTRFREELRRGQDVETSLALALATAGRAVAFSGLTVMAALSGLFFYQGTWLGTIAGPLVTVVALAVFFAFTLLSSTLAILGHRVNALRVPLPSQRRPGAFWHGLATWVMRRPWLVLLPTLALVLVAASPFTQIDLATDHLDMLPASAESRQASEILLRAFPQFNQDQFPVVVQYPSGNPLSAAHVGALYDLSRRIAALPDVVAIHSPVNLNPRLTRGDYIALYARPRAQWPTALQREVRQDVGRNIAVLQVLTNQPSHGQGARTLVRRIRALGRHPVAPAPRGGGTRVELRTGGRLLVTGDPASDMDRTAWILRRTPWAIAFVIGITFLILLVLLGSVVLPLKAVITNLLSISVSFGVMVWVFQEGHLSSALGFTPGPIDPTVPVIMFCLIFGLSMDYEVFLLSRIQEEYGRSGDNSLAVAFGLERCGRLVTFAAAIMVAVFASFTLNDVVVVKAAGLCTAVAVAVDATLMRGLIVPAAMVLMRRANWWVPAWLADVIQRLGLRELRAEPRQAP
jgi:RND superfamily putative drug exporter